jgi:hypothetical protein
MTDATQQVIEDAVQTAIRQFIAPLTEKIVEAVSAATITASDDGKTDEILSELISAVGDIERTAGSLTSDIESAVYDIQSGISSLECLSVDEEAIGTIVDAADSLKKNLIG